jgi:hypothetical protein
VSNTDKLKTSNFIYDNLHQCFLLNVPEEVLQKVNWKLCDDLAWCFKNNKVYIKTMRKNE